MTAHDAKPRLLIAGDAVAPTGYARVIHSLFSRLTATFDIVQLGVNYSGDPHDWPWPIYRADLAGDPYGVRRLVSLCESCDIDQVLLVNDIEIVAQCAAMLAESAWRQRGRVFAYCPVDAGPLNPAHVSRLRHLDALVTYTDFAAGQIRACARRIAQRDACFALPPLYILAHGIDQDVFFPLSASRKDSIRLARQRFFGSDDGDEDFIVLNANRNQPRKRIDITMQGFADFARDKPDTVKLFLYMGIRDKGWDIVEMAQRLGIEDRLIIYSEQGRMPCLPTEQMNLLYNACDVGVNTSTGEGWGLVSFEHAAVGAPQIVPGHSACLELWRDCAHLLPEVYRATSPLNMAEECFVSPRDLARALEQLYRDEGERERWGELARRNACLDARRWDHLARQWRDLLCAAPVA